MGAVLQDGMVQEFMSRFEQELEFLLETNPGGSVKGAQITNSAREILMIDLRCADFSQAIEELPLEIKALVANAFKSPTAKWGVYAQIEMVRRVRGVVDADDS